MFFSGLKNWKAIKRSNSNFAIFFITFIWGTFYKAKIQIFVTTADLFKALNYENLTIIEATAAKGVPTLVADLIHKELL